jgi:peptidoglycan/LPS O-acetylase OafA/YrhL
LSHLPIAYTIDSWSIARPATFAMFLATALASIAISTVTYLVIERPFQRIRFGWRSVRAAPSVATDPSAS